MAFNKSFKANEKSIINRTDECINIYLHDAKKSPILSAAEQSALVAKCKMGGKVGERAKDRLVRSNLLFVVSVANSYTNRGLELMDLIEEGNYGLVQAIDLYNPSMGCTFITFAVNYIRKAILLALQTNKGQVRLPDNKHRILNIYYKVAEKMFGEDLYAVKEAACRKAKCSMKTLEAIIAASSNSVALDETINDEDGKGRARIELMASDSYADADINNECKMAVLYDAIASLSPREQMVICRRFGFNGFEESLDNISKDLGVGREQTRKILNGALEKLRHSDFAPQLAIEIAA